MAKRKATSLENKKTGIGTVRSTKEATAVVRVTGPGKGLVRAPKEVGAVLRVTGTGISAIRAAKEGPAMVRVTGTGIYTKKLGARLAVSAKPVNTRKYHVIIGNGEKWTVVADGNTRATRVFETKLRAIEFATSVAKRIDGEVIIHKETGEIEDRISLAK